MLEASEKLNSYRSEIAIVNKILVRNYNFKSLYFLNRRFDDFFLNF